MQETVPSEPLDLEPGDYGQIAWLSDRWLAVTFTADPLSVGPASEIWRLDSEGLHFRRQALPTKDGCSVTSFSAPTSLPEGRLGVVRHCFRQAERPDLDEFDVLFLDASLESEIDSGISLGFDPTQISWNDSLQRGVASTGDDTCSTLVWFTPSRISYPTIHININDEDFVIDQSLVEPESGDCTDKARAAFPSLAPDGELAFFASPQSIGLVGQERGSAPWNLYLMSSGGDIQSVLSDVRFARSLVWSTNGEWLGFSGDPGGRGLGTWVFSTTSNKLVRVTYSFADWLAWSPDGTRIVGVFDAGNDDMPSANRLTVFDLSAISA